MLVGRVQQPVRPGLQVLPAGGQQERESRGRGGVQGHVCGGACHRPGRDGLPAAGARPGPRPVRLPSAPSLLDTCLAVTGTANTV